MVREIEHVLGARIERRKLPDFDYSSFTPENLSRQGRTGRPRELQSPRTYSRAGKGYDRAIKAQEPSGRPARRGTGNENSASLTPPRRPQQRRQFAASSAKSAW